MHAEEPVQGVHFALPENPGGTDKLDQLRGVPGPMSVSCSSSARVAEYVGSGTGCFRKWLLQEVVAVAAVRVPSLPITIVK